MIGLAVASQLPFIAEAAAWKDKPITRADLDEYIRRRFAGFRLALIGNPPRTLAKIGEGEPWWAPPLVVKSFERGKVEFHTAEVKATTRLDINTMVFVDHEGYRFGDQADAICIAPNDILKVSYKITWTDEVLAQPRDYVLRDRGRPMVRA